MKKYYVLALLVFFSIQCWAIYCPVCGNKNPDEAKYCMQCGRVIKQEQSQENTSKIIIEPQSFEDKLSYEKYQDWKNEYNEVKADKHAGLLVAGLGLFSYLLSTGAPAPYASLFGSLGLGFTVVGLIVEAANSASTKEAELEEIGRKNGWLYK